jgi:hypothetical protein
MSNTISRKFPEASRKCSGKISEVSRKSPMAKTTESLARELNVSDRQVINYKKAVEAHLGFPITYRQGRTHFYFEEFLPFLEMVKNGQPLPQIEREALVEVLPPEPPVIGGGQMTISTRQIAAAEPITAVPLTLTRLDTRAIEAQTTHNRLQQGTFKDQIRAVVLNDAETFAEELKVEVKQTITRGVAEAYRDVAAL